MIKDVLNSKNILSVGAATVFCGAALYAVGQTLSYLFRDVDPERIEREKEKELEAEECTADESGAAEPEAEECGAEG